VNRHTPIFGGEVGFGKGVGMGASLFPEYRPRQSDCGAPTDQRRCVVVSSVGVPNPHHYGATFQALTVVFLTPEGTRAATIEMPKGQFEKRMDRTGRVLCRRGDYYLVDALLSRLCVHDEAGGRV